MEHGILNTTWLGSLKKLTLWRDPVARTGAESMAVDELLLAMPGSWLRIYKWLEPTVSFGYFDTEAEARRLFPDEGISFVRRWTGGGIVDHRSDTPFTLALAREDRPGNPTSPALYRWIHGDLAAAMRNCGVDCMLLDEDAPAGGRACWASPVANDIADAHGNKLAGGGQRRNPSGILHQGSIQGCMLPEEWDLLFAHMLAGEVNLVVEAEPAPGFGERVRRLALEKYASATWNAESRGRRPLR